MSAELFWMALWVMAGHTTLAGGLNVGSATGASTRHIYIINTTGGAFFDGVTDGSDGYMQSRSYNASATSNRTRS